MTLVNKPVSVVLSNSILGSRLLKEKPLVYRWYVLPFVFLYLLWGVGLGYLQFKGVPSWLFYKEFYLIPLALIFLAHFLIYMSRFWSLKAYSKLDFDQAFSLGEAKNIYLEPKEHRGKPTVTPIHRDDQLGTYFVFQQQKYLYDAEKKLFSKPFNRMHFTVKEALEQSGHSTTEHQQVLERVGENRFSIPVPTFVDLFKEHAVAPFFVFQVFCVGLWCLDDFWYYSLFTLFMLIVFESTVVYQRLRNIKDFQTMSIPAINVRVKRGDEWIETKSNMLVPGDLCQLSIVGEELVVPCDFLLINGSCIVNEAMLSGESIPLLKEPVSTLNDDESLDLLSSEKRGYLVFGGTKILQITLPNEPLTCLVVNTGFSTVQGRLVRMMMFSNERVTANNLESFMFILFLMVFAVISAVYVLIKGSEDKDRSRYKLLVECALIITAVVPPELPMELSLAVNTSLMALSKLAIFCMEPFRIPFAGKVDVCCFDKTGTLTNETLIVDGVDLAGKGGTIKEKKDVPLSTGIILASCHSLFKLSSSTQEKKISGDPMEKAAIEFIGAVLDEADLITYAGHVIKIYHRFVFSSALKRMSTIVGVSGKGVLATVKGAPEVIREMLKIVPSDYDKTYKHLARTGARVIALAYKSVKTSGDMTVEKARKYHRDDMECDLEFSGFLCLRCPLKNDSKGAITALINSQHHVIMITGDNYLTAVHTAKELKMLPGTQIFIGDVDSKDNLVFSDYETESKIHTERLLEDQSYVCLNGDAFNKLLNDERELLDKIERKIIVFSRASPVQKEQILAYFNSRGLTTLMCGDGTNDVGALKQSHVGIALLDGKPEDMQKILREMRLQAFRKQKAEMEATAKSIREKFGVPEPPSKPQGSDQNPAALMMGGGDAEDGPTFKLGDASVAAPFSSRISTVESVCHIIRQGRCTLVTTIQMYKILAVNSLITAYGLSVLNLKGVRYGDFQATISGLLLSACFMFLTKAEPIKKLSPMRPQSNIFNAYLLTSVMGQFLLHISALFYVVTAASKYEFTRAIDPKNPFEKGLVNTSVYILSLLMQVSTFVINYQGRPFRESLFENRPLRNALSIVGMISIVAALELLPEFNEWLQLVIMPELFKKKLIMAMSLDWLGCAFVEWASWRLFFTTNSNIKKVN
jgi:manganese-transporting P-type ATPase